MFAPRYFPKVGAAVVFQAVWAVNSNRTIGMDIQP